MNKRITALLLVLTMLASTAALSACKKDEDTVESEMLPDKVGYIRVSKFRTVTAEQFAEASECDLGQIQTAGQGQFEIEDRDQNTPYIKKLRVVTTITYSLKE